MTIAPRVRPPLEAAGPPVRSELPPVSDEALGAVEGLAAGDELTALQKSFHDHHALQCGYCTPGMLMSATALLTTNHKPTDADIDAAMSGNVCRCATYVRIRSAIKRAASTLA